MERRNREWDEVRWGAAVLVAPFIGPEDGRGGGAVRGNGQRRRCAIKAFKPSVLGGERRGQWGVKRGQKCGAVSGRGGVVGVAGACGEVVAAVPSRASGGRRWPGSLTGWARLSVRGRRWGRPGQKGREEAGPKSFLRLKSKRVKENQF
jgi:hypothetical protein